MDNDLIQIIERLQDSVSCLIKDRSKFHYQNSLIEEYKNIIGALTLEKSELDQKLILAQRENIKLNKVLCDIEKELAFLIKKINEILDES